MYTKEIKKLFGKKKMSVPNFKKAIKHLPAEEKQRWEEKVFICTFCYYSKKNKTFREFLDTFMVSHRQEYLNYIRQHTYLGHKLYHYRKDR